MMTREREIKNYIKKELIQYFHIMSDSELQKSIINYNSVKDKKKRAHRMSKRNPPPTDYNEEVIKKFGTRQKAIKSITKEVQEKIRKKFGIVPEKKIQGTNFRIDLFDDKEKICYEIALGNGTEIWKDIIKALIVNAKKLVIFARSYPNPWGMQGYNYIERHWDVLNDKIDLEVELIDFMSNEDSRPRGC